MRETGRAEQLGRQIARWVVLAGVVGAVVVWLYLAVLTPVLPTEEDIGDSPVEEVIGVGIASTLGYLYVRRSLTMSLRWTDLGRPPTAEERARLLTQPRRIALLSLAVWGFGAVFTFGYNATLGGEPTAAGHFHNTAGFLLGGLTSSLVAFLLIERALRPTYAIALAGQVPDASPALPIRLRLLLAWALGSALPVLAIAVAPFGRDAEDRADLTTGITFLAAVAVAAGGLITTIVARSVAQPLSDIRSALTRVKEGDLDVHVTVDDAGEIGFVQAGVNEMAAGLRERQRVQDLFGRHVGPEVARRALDRGVALGGEEREASALFVDIIGSSEMAQRLAAPDVVSILNDFFRTVVSVVGEEAGWVNKFEGDGALCVFGVLDDVPDHAGRALRAARELRHRLSIEVGIGVSSGNVVAGNVGAEERYEYTVIGDPVNEAARLTDEAKLRPARVLASQGCVDRVGEEEARCWRPAGSFRLRGRAGPTMAFEPAGE